jgi:hypothetical protein
MKLFWFVFDFCALWVLMFYVISPIVLMRSV